MMQQADRQRLTHIYEYCVSIEKAIQRFGSDFQSFDCDEDFQHSLSFCLLQIGELGGDLSDDGYSRVKGCLRGAIEHLRLFLQCGKQECIFRKGWHRQEMLSLNEQYVYQCCDFGCNLSMYLVD